MTKLSFLYLPIERQPPVGDTVVSGFDFVGGGEIVGAGETDGAFETEGAPLGAGEVVGDSESHLGKELSVLQSPWSHIS